MMEYNDIDKVTITNITATYNNKDYKISLQHVWLGYLEQKYDEGEIKDYSFIYEWEKFVEENLKTKPDVIETSDGQKYGRGGSIMYENGIEVRKPYFKYLTEQEFAQVLEQIKTQYPAGTYWGTDTRYKSKSGGVKDACSGFVAMVTDTAVGCISEIGSFTGRSGGCWEIHKVNSPSELKLYDIVSYTNHTAIVTGFTENGVLVCEGNHGSQVCWDCEESYDELFAWNSVYAGSFINH